MVSGHASQSMIAFIEKSSVQDVKAQDLWRDCEKVIPAALAEFYAGLSATSEYGEMLSSESVVDRLKRAQTDHWRELFAPVLSEDFAERSERIGKAHVQIKLPASWYLAGYAFLLKKLMPELARKYKFNPKRLAAALDLLVQRVFTDIILSTSAYDNGSQSLRTTKALKDSDLSNLGNAALMVKDANETALELASLTRSTGNVSSNSQTISAAAAEMVASVEEIARNSESAASEAMQTDRTVGEGKDAVDHVATAITNIAAAVDETAASVDELSSASEQIGQILGVIEGIAGQTNLLALNATIEAARAGEAGKGFAVVAAEVKSLASQTAKATEDINRRIAALRSGMADIMKTMERSNSAVDEGRQAIARAAGTMDTIAGQVSSVTGKMREISSILGQQKQTSSDIASSIDEVAGIAADNTSILQVMADKMNMTNNRFGDLAKGWFDATSPRSLCEMAKIDHIFFKKRIVDALSGRFDEKAANLPDHHACRLGKWYDGIDNPAIRALPAYGRLVAPHEKVHAYGKRALEANTAGRVEEAFRELDLLNNASHDVLDLLDELSQGIAGIEYGAERRSEVRHPTAENASADIAGKTRPVTILDRSASGMRIEGITSDEVGQRIKLTFRDGSCCSGHTRWALGTQGGVRFETIAAE